MDPGQNGMGGHGAYDMARAGRRSAGVGRPAVGFDRRARGDVGRDEAMQRGGGKVLDHGQAEASGRIGFNFVLPLGERPPLPQTELALVCNGSSVTSTC